MILSQTHVATAAGIQTLAARPAADGVTLYSFFSRGDAAEDGQFHVPAAAATWLAGVVAGLAKGHPGHPAGTLAERIRTIAANPGPDSYAELGRVAAEVARLVARLDEIAGDASEQAQAMGPRPPARLRRRG
jgi:hypothetical protein